MTGKSGRGGLQGGLRCIEQFEDDREIGSWEITRRSEVYRTVRR